MKFKAVLSRNGVKTFVSIAQSIQKVAEECAIHMNEEFFEFRVKPDAANGIQVFAKMHTESFTEYRIESKAENNITVVVRVRNLIRAFKSADQAMDAVFKLTKPGSIPCFTVVASDVTTCLAVKQDIPISQILSAAGRNEYREPRLPTPDIAMEFPDPRHVKMILEKMKPLDKFVHMEASSRFVNVLKLSACFVIGTKSNQSINQRISNVLMNVLGVCLYSKFKPNSSVCEPSFTAWKCSNRKEAMFRKKTT